MKSITREQYLQNILDLAMFYNKNNSQKQWAQNSTVKGRAIALAKTKLKAYKENGDTEGVLYVNYVIKKLRSMK